MNKDTEKTITIEGSGGFLLSGASSVEFKETSTSADFLKSTKIPTPSDLYKAGKHLEDQKVKNVKKARQLLLSEAELKGDELEKEVEVSGLDLTVGEDRALSALQILLDKNDYQGNLPSHEITSASLQAWQTLKTTPAQSFTWTEYFEAYGLKKTGGQYKGHQVENAKKDLESLATKARRLVYKRRRWEKTKGGKNKKVYDLVVWKGTLIQILEGYEGLDTAEASLVEAGQDIKTRKHKVAVVFAPIFIDGILDYFLLKPKHLHEELKAITGKKVSPATIRLVSYLMTLDFSPLPIAKETLIERLRLDYLIKERHNKRADKILQESYDIAKKAGYLLDYGQDEYGLLHFQLNPERCWRYKMKLAKAKKEEIGEKNSNLLE
jgi:hypothetical protein